MTAKFLLVLMTTAVCVSACDTIKEEVGLTRHSPDEFAVMQRAPLEIPADLNTLPKPQPGMPRPQDVSAKDKAKDVLLGEGAVATATTESKAESVLLEKAGATKASPHIRQELSKDSVAASEDKRAVVKRLLNIGSDEAPATVVDAEAEAKRIQDAKKAGQPVTVGETPTVEQ